MTQTATNVALAILRSIRGRREGGHVENELWPALKSCGVSRRDFDDAVDRLLAEVRVVRSYDRIYVPYEGDET